MQPAEFSLPIAKTVQSILIIARAATDQVVHGLGGPREPDAWKVAQT